MPRAALRHTRLGTDVLNAFYRNYCEILNGTKRAFTTSVAHKPAYFDLMDINFFLKGGIF